MKYRTAYPNELCHYGVLGMHWGVRRYQNYDGTRIAAGSPPIKRPSSLKGGSQKIHVGTGEVMRKSLGANYKKSVAGGQGGKAEGNAKLAAKAPNPYLERSVKQGKGKEDITPAEKIAKDTRSASESSKKIVEAVERHDPKLKEKKAAAERSQAQKAKKMSDQELRNNINRIKMEREYVSLTTKETSSGYDKAKEILSVVGDVAGVVLALVSIYATIKSVKKLKQSGIDDSDEEALMHSMLEDGNYDDEFISHAIALDDEYVADYIDDFLEHHGIKGMKWGVRRFQNYDGTRIATGSGVGGGGGGSSKKPRKSLRAREEAKLAVKKDPVGEEYLSTTNALNDHIDKMDKLDNDFDSGKIDAKTYEKERSKLDDEYEKLYNAQMDAGMKWIEQQTKVHEKELTAINKEYNKIEKEIEKAFNDGDDKAVDDLIRKLQKLDSDRNKFYSYPQ